MRVDPPETQLHRRVLLGHHRLLTEFSEYLYFGLHKSTAAGRKWRNINLLDRIRLDIRHTYYSYRHDSLSAQI
jgi:hypothetical protein